MSNNKYAILGEANTPEAIAQQHAEEAAKAEQEKQEQQAQALEAAAKAREEKAKAGEIELINEADLTGLNINDKG